MEMFSVLLAICWGSPAVIGGFPLQMVNDADHWRSSLVVTWTKSRWLTTLLALVPKSTYSAVPLLTHWGRVTHICAGKLTIIGSDNGLSPERRQAIIWTNAGMLLIGPLGTNFNEILIEIQTFSLKKIYLKMSSAKCCSFRLGLNVLTRSASQICSRRARHSLPVRARYVVSFISSTLIDILPQFLRWYMQYADILDRVMTTLDCISSLSSVYDLSQNHDHVMLWKCFQHYWPFVGGVRRFSVGPLH